MGWLSPTPSHPKHEHSESYSYSLKFKATTKDFSLSIESCWILYWHKQVVSNWNCDDCARTASPKVLKIFSHPQTRDQSQVVQNDKLSQESVETKIFVGGNGTFSHFFEKKLKKMWKKISKKIFFFTKICFSGLEKPYVQLLVLNFFSDFDLQKLIFGNFEEFSLFFEVF